VTVHLDTHVAVWLRMGDARRLRPVKRVLDREELRLSPYVLLELQALFEIGRLRETGRWIAERLAEDHGVQLAQEALASAGDRALDLSFTRDPYDRLIAAHALAARATLLTADEVLLKHVSCARWG
jgi:PIN domain nuclease of toxin-antitoxin system